MTRATDQQLASLEALVSPGGLSTDAGDLVAWGQDWTRFTAPDPSAILFVRSQDELNAVVKWANAERMALVPSGGRTGLSGGAVAPSGEIVISFDKMNHILSFSEIDRTLTVEAGVVTKVLQDYAVQQGLFYPVDFASSGSSQIGGNIATNAGGIKVLRYGLTRDWVAGLEVVTGQGESLSLNQGLVKNATGYDLRHLFIGSEGTLGFVTQATMRLADAPKPLTVMLLAVDRMTDTIAILSAFGHVPLTAFEFFSDQALSHVTEHLDIRKPFGKASNYYVLLEYENASPDDQVNALDAFERVVAAGLATDGIEGTSGEQNRELWLYREGISESITRFSPYKNDISVRISDVPAFLADVETQVNSRYPDFEIIWFGHIGDGNVHLNILKPDVLGLEDFRQHCARVSHDILKIVARYKGSISAEHGVGLLKKEHLHYTRSQEEIALMRSLKKAFDPLGIMNPGKLLP